MRFFMLTVLGGPLDEGDIEDVGNEVVVICPWHSYDFNLRTGASSTGLKVGIQIYCIYF